MRLTRTIVLSTGLLAACRDSNGVQPPPAPEPATIVAISDTMQVGPVGALVNDLPAVRVTDAAGRTLRGVGVSFTTSSGAPAPQQVTTGADGVATIASWRYTAGRAQLTATVGALAPVVFSAEGKGRDFDLQVRWLLPPTAAAQAAVSGAEATLEELIWEDVVDADVVDRPLCSLPGLGPQATINERVDDVLILAHVLPIDGPGGAGAQGFPCLIRDPGTQTIVGYIRLDVDDFTPLPPGLQREIALHEMVHALGFVPGVLNITTPSGFQRACVALPSTGGATPLVQDTHYTCASGREGFARIGGSAYTGLKVPLENGATRPLGSGTLNHHWRKTSLRGELMTGWFDLGVTAPLSALTAGALADLGYGVSFEAAEGFQLVPPIAARIGGMELTEPVITEPPVQVRVGRPGPGKLTGR